MKNKAIEIAALILGLLTTAAGVLTLPQVALLPQEWQPFVALSLALVVVGKNAAYVVLDFCDDGQLNKSYKLPGERMLIGLLALTLLVPSCTTGPQGARLFLGISGADALGIGQNVLKREALPVLNEALTARVRNAQRTAAKQPLNVLP
jgi:hypothetical protein